MDKQRQQLIRMNFRRQSMIIVVVLVCSLCSICEAMGFLPTPPTQTKSQALKHKKTFDDQTEIDLDCSFENGGPM